MRQRVLADGSLDLEIRDGRINLYYRGLNALAVVEKDAGRYSFELDLNYAKTSHSQLGGVAPATPVATQQQCESWLERLAHVKDAIDCWCGVVKGAREKEIQQLLVSENNRPGTGRGTDYFICDVEHARTGHDFRFDAVAVKWPSRGEDRKRIVGLRLALVEVKFGEGAVGGAAGLASHVRDVEAFVSFENGAELAKLKEEMVTIFRQKHELELVDCGKPFEAFSAEKPELILVLANQDPDSDVLRNELARIPPARAVDVVVAHSNLMGLGLYRERMVPLADFLPLRPRPA